jgi:L-ascorbate metabolism protein UlaG (beta-lactamase superfamily)
MQLTYLGHSAFILKTSNTKLLFDPFLTGNPVAEAAGITPQNLLAQHTDIAAICLTHGHGDHVGDSVFLSAQAQIPVVANYELANWLTAQQSKAVQHFGINMGGTVKFGDVSVKMVPAAHTSSLPDGTYGGVAAGFIVRTPELCVYISGDTGLMADMKLIAEIEKPDLAVLCIGGYFTMDYIDACLACDLLNIKKAIGVHYDTFGPIAIDHTAAQNHFAAQGKQLILPTVGVPLSL